MASNNINPQGYEYGIQPKNINPFWGGDGGTGFTFTPVITPIIEDEEEKGYTLSWENDGELENPDPVNLYNGEKGDKGDKGDTGATGATGATPVITATASVDSTTGTPAVTVTKTGDPETPNINFSFTGLKGADGTDGTDGTDGVTPVITATASVDANTGTPAVSVTKSGSDASPFFNFAFSNLKGLTGFLDTILHGFWIDSETQQPITEKAGQLNFIELNGDANNANGLTITQRITDGTTAQSIIRGLPYWSGGTEGSILTNHGTWLSFDTPSFAKKFSCVNGITASDLYNLLTGEYQGEYNREIILVLPSYGFSYEDFTQGEFRHTDLTTGTVTTDTVTGLYQISDPVIVKIVRNSNYLSGAWMNQHVITCEWGGYSNNGSCIMLSGVSTHEHKAIPTTAEINARASGSPTSISVYFEIFPTMKQNVLYYNSAPQSKIKLQIPVSSISQVYYR